MHGAIRLILVLIGLAIAVPTLSIAAIAAGLGGGGPSISLALLIVGLIALVPTAAIERRHFWVTLIPLGLIVWGALSFYVEGGFFGAS